MRNYKDIQLEGLTGRERRLLWEWRGLVERFASDATIEIEVSRYSAMGLATEYRVIYHIHTMCGVEGDPVEEEGESYDLRGSQIEGSTPIFADKFIMTLKLPPSYPCVDGAPQLQFVSCGDDGESVATPWHPNIRYYGSFKGRVCLNALDSSVELSWCVDRVAKYLRYELYHSIQEPPFPEDLRVARWLNHNIDLIPWDEIR